MGFCLDATVQQLLAFVLLFVLVWGISGSVDTDDFQRQFRNKTGIMVGLGCQFLLLPFVGFCVVKLTGLSKEQGISLIVVTSSPGGSYSNWWCSLFNTDLSLSVAMTTASTIMSIGFLPLNLAIYITGAYGESAQIPWAELFTSIAVVMTAILSGLATSFKMPHWRIRANKIGNIGGLSMIALTAYVVWGQCTEEEDDTLVTDDDEGPDDDGWQFYVGVALPCLLGILFSVVITSLPCFALKKPERSSVCVECCYQNTGLAMAIAVNMPFSQKEIIQAAKVPVYYGAVEIIFLGIFCFMAWQLNWTYAPRTDPFYKVVSENYQEVAAVHRERNWSVAHLETTIENETAEGIADTDGPLQSRFEAPLHENVPSAAKSELQRESEMTTASSDAAEVRGSRELSTEVTRQGSVDV